MIHPAGFSVELELNFKEGCPRSSRNRHRCDRGIDNGERIKVWDVADILIEMEAAI